MTEPQSLTQDKSAEFQQISEKIRADQVLNSALDYITEFIRQVIENGHNFTNNHIYILLLHLTPGQINQDLASYLKVILDEFGLERPGFNRFLDGLNDKELFYAFQEIRHILYP
jgi:hypothetical protein